MNTLKNGDLVLGKSIERYRRDGGSASLSRQKVVAGKVFRVADGENGTSTVRIKTLDGEQLTARYSIKRFTRL